METHESCRYEKANTQMRVIIVGVGDVGTSLTKRLADSHELTVVDHDEDQLEAIASSDHIRTIHGDGRSLETLREAGLSDADVLMASSDSDGANIMICGAVKHSTDITTIARVKRIELYETWQDAGEAFGIDHMLCVNLLTAQAIVRTTTLPSALAVDTFADEQVEIAEFAIDADNPIAEQTIEEADRFASLTFAGILREGDVIIPNGATTVEPEDKVIVIGSTSSVSRFARTLAGRTTFDSDASIVVAGGGQVGVRTARLFGSQGFKTQVIEHDRERASEVASSLPDATIVERDATSIEFLRSERIDGADAVVSTLGDDQENYLVSLLASHFGVPHTVTVVDAAEHVDLFDAAGIEVAARPRDIVAGEIAQVALGAHADSVTLIESDSAEILEVTITSESVLAGELLRAVADDLPDGFVVGAIVRGGTVTPPRGGTVIQTGDHVIAFLDSEIVDDVAPKL